MVSDGGHAIHEALKEVKHLDIHQRDVWHIFQQAAKVQGRLEALVQHEEERLRTITAYEQRKAGGQSLSGRPPKTSREQQCKAVEGLMHLWEAVAYLFRELHHLLEVVIVDETSVSGLMSLATRQQELETVVSLLAELHEQVPASLQHHLSAMARVVELALLSLLHFAHLLEDRHQQAVQALGGEAVHLIAWAWQRRMILGPEMHTLLQGLAPAWRSTAHMLLESWTQAVRASSVVENWHSIVRPHLAVHRTRIAQACWLCWPFGTIIALRLVVLMLIGLLYNAVKLLRSKPIGLPPLAIFLPLLDCSICHMDLNLALRK